MRLPACSLVSSVLAIPVIVFGAVSLIQQARQAKEDKDLRLKAINTHITFLSQEDEETDQPEQLSNVSSISSGDRQDTASPAMLDHPERPEPSAPGAPGDPARAAEQEHSKLPPQTAVLDRPERPEPDTAFSDADLTTQTDVTAPLAQPPVSAASRVVVQAPARPHNPCIVAIKFFVRALVMPAMLKQVSSSMHSFVTGL